MTPSPYRPEPSSLPVPRRRVSVWLVLLAALLPATPFRRYRWYRRATGGRWTMRYRREHLAESWSSRWEQHLHCPATGPSALYETASLQRWACTQKSETVDCHCEEWGTEP